MITIGVDAHKRMHVALALDDAGQELGQWPGGPGAYGEGEPPSAVHLNSHIEVTITGFHGRTFTGSVKITTVSDNKNWFWGRGKVQINFANGGSVTPEFKKFMANWTPQGHGRYTNVVQGDWSSDVSQGMPSEIGLQPWWWEQSGCASYGKELFNWDMQFFPLYGQ